MKQRIKIISMSLDGHDIPITPDLSELLSDPSCWSTELYVEPAFLKDYTSRTERNENGNLVTIYEKRENHGICTVLNC
ncbi:hypothetical protein C8K15_11023 [Paenisporosarcina sp. OV554]|nr:hypothetical protein C8K15_11023 [Paenisporosarcina sp. OV554]